jgi:hypothetical protein
MDSRVSEQLGHYGGVAPLDRLGAKPQRHERGARINVGGLMRYHRWVAQA